MRGKDYNSIFVDLQLAGISCFQNFLKAVIDSDYAKEFNPFTDYLDRLAPGTGRTISANWRKPYRPKTNRYGQKASGGGSWEWWHAHCAKTR